MKKEPLQPDPLGTRPPPLTGDPVPRFADEALRERSEAALATCLGIWVANDRQDMVIAQVRSYLGAWHLADEKEACGGRRLSQYSQAGKSATMRRLKKVLAKQRRTRGLAPSKYQVVIVTLRKRLTLNQLYRAILKKMGCPHWNQEKISVDTLLCRIEEHAALIGMELLVIDEIQHLDNDTKDAEAVLHQLKVFVDEAYFPIVFVGDEDSLPFFERNQKLAARLGDPLELRPLKPLENDDDALAFQKLCHKFDLALVKADVFTRPAGLSKKLLLDGLMIASGGHVGRVASLLQIAVPHAIWRGADAVEAFDLSHAVRSYAIKNNWVGFDPWSDRG